MARPRREKRPLPPPLPPETRTIGQLIAEAMRLYSRRFWPSLALGVVPAGVAVGTAEVSDDPWAWFAIGAGSAFLFSGVVVAACVIALDVRPTRATFATAYLTGVVIWLAVPVVAFAVLGLAVPAALVEGRRGLDALRRGYRLMTADPAHSLGAIAGLLVTWWVTASVMTTLIRAGSHETVQIAAALSTLVVSPVFFLGSALLYRDQAARVSSPRQTRRSRDAALPDAVDPDRSGS